MESSGSPIRDPILRKCVCRMLGCFYRFLGTGPPGVTTGRLIFGIFVCYLLGCLDTPLEWKFWKPELCSAPSSCTVRVDRVAVCVSKMMARIAPAKSQRTLKLPAVGASVPSVLWKFCHLKQGQAALRTFSTPPCTKSLCTSLSVSTTFPIFSLRRTTS